MAPIIKNTINTTDTRQPFVCEMVSSEVDDDAAMIRDNNATCGGSKQTLNWTLRELRGRNAF